MSSKIDENFGTVALVVDGTGAIVPLRVDPVTGYVLAIVVAEVGNDLDIPTKIDENFEGVAMGTDEVSGLARPLKVVPLSGALLCKVM